MRNMKVSLRSIVGHESFVLSSIQILLRVVCFIQLDLEFSFGSVRTVGRSRSIVYIAQGGTWSLVQ